MVKKNKLEKIIRGIKRKILPLAFASAIALTMPGCIYYLPELINDTVSLYTTPRTPLTKDQKKEVEKRYRRMCEGGRISLRAYDEHVLELGLNSPADTYWRRNVKRNWGGYSTEQGFFDNVDIGGPWNK